MLKDIWRKPRNASRRDPKTKAMQLQHAWKRLLGRFGIALHLTEIEQIVTNIQHNQYPLLTKQSRRVSVFQVTIEGRELAAVYDRDRHAIMTFLPLEWIDGVPKVTVDTIYNGDERYAYRHLGRSG